MVLYNNPMSVLESPGRRLRQAWQARPIAIPGVFNSLVAKMAQRLGFQAVYLSGGALSAAAGVPDVGLLTLNDFVDFARSVAQTVQLPLLCDADTGFGEALNVERTVQLFEQAGVAGIHLEDQVLPSAVVICRARGWSKQRRWLAKSGQPSRLAKIAIS